MARYNEVKVFTFGSLVGYRNIIPDDGVSLDVEVWSGNTWTLDDISPMTTPQSFNLRNTKIRVTPTPIDGGFFVDDEA
jgi:hypothetical protein